MPWNFVRRELSSVIVPVVGSARSRRMWPRRKLLSDLMVSFLTSGFDAVGAEVVVADMEGSKGRSWERVWRRASSRASAANGCVPIRSVRSQRRAGFSSSAAPQICAMSPPGPAWRPGERNSKAMMTGPELKPGARSWSARIGWLCGCSSPSIEAATTGPTVEPGRSRRTISAIWFRSAAERGEGPP